MIFSNAEFCSTYSTGVGLETRALWEIGEKLGGKIDDFKGRPRQRIYFDFDGGIEKIVKKDIYIQEKICLNILVMRAEKIEPVGKICDKICEKLGNLDWNKIGSKVELAIGDEIDHVIDFKVETQRKGKRFAEVSSFEITAMVVEKISHVNSNFRWRARVQPKPAVVMRIFINDDFILVDLPVMGRIDQSGGRKCVGLASPVAWVMNRQARWVKENLGCENFRNLVVLDPFCGTGATIFERSEARWGVGVDCEKFQMEKFSENCAFLSEVGVDGILGDARRLGARKNIFDIIVCDLPFGVKWCAENWEKLEEIYRKSIAEFERVCESSGVMVSEIDHVIDLSVSFRFCSRRSLWSSW